jgi:hypothetical protein
MAIPAGVFWACCGESPARHVGIVFGVGNRVLGLVAEAVVSELVAELQSQGQEASASMIRDAAAQLPGFKATLRRRDAANTN